MADLEMSYTRFAAIAGGVARNPETPEAILTLLANCEDTWIRANLSGNPNAPQWYLDECASSLSFDELYAVRMAENPKSPQLAFMRASQSYRENARLNLLFNDSAAPQALRSLYHEYSTGPYDLSEKDNIIGHIVANENTPVDILEEVASRYLTPFTAEMLMKNANTPISIALTMASSPLASFRKIAAGSRITTKSVLAMLATDSDEDVRLSVALNPVTEDWVRKRIADDIDLYLLESTLDGFREAKHGGMMSLIESGNLSPSAYATSIDFTTINLMDGLFRIDPFADLLQLCGEDKDACLCIAENEHASPSVLNQLKDHPNKSVRTRVASHPNCPSSALSDLAYDTDTLVAATAIGNPLFDESTLAMFVGITIKYLSLFDR